MRMASHIPAGSNQIWQLDLKFLAAHLALVRVHDSLASFLADWAPARLSFFKTQTVSATGCIPDLVNNPLSKIPANT